MDGGSRDVENRTRMTVTTRRIASRHRLRRRRRLIGGLLGGSAARARALLFTTSTISDLAHSISGVLYFKGRRRGENKYKRGRKREFLSSLQYYVVETQRIIAGVRKK